MGEEPRPADSTVAHRYRIEGRLGRGGMADVLAAHDTVLDRRVAIKLLRDAPDSETARARFVSESRILAGLSHPGLVTVLDAGISGEQPYLVMELLPGGTVADLIERGSQPVDRVCDLGAQVAAALASVHAAGVVHRDVKPSNILIDAWERARLADFGIARLVADTVRSTATGTTVGTMGYLAPEQASGSDITTAVDIYSLGLVLLELLTGVPAFPGTATEAAVARLTRDPAVPHGLPEPLQRLLAEMTAREPSARPAAAHAAQRLASASTTAAEARAAQAHIDTQAVLPVVAGQPSAEAWWRRRRTRRGGLVVAAAGIAIALGLGLGLADGLAPAAGGAIRAGADATPPQPSAPREAPATAAVQDIASKPDAPKPVRAQPKNHKPKHHKPKHHKPKHHKPKHHKPKHHKPPKHHH